MSLNNSSTSRPPRVLLTGATGFVGRHVYPALVSAGFDVRAGSRNPDQARRSLGDWNWVACDVDRPESLGAALEGCDAALYLVHQMHGGGGDYPERERQSATRFGEAARREGLQRLVYLGGVVPKEGGSRHLESRSTTGRALRASGVPTFELRAGMIIGPGSQSWIMVRDLAARLPAMVLPRWLRRHSWPIAIDDIVVALLLGLRLPETMADCYDVPGPERIAHRELLDRVSRTIRGRPPVSVFVPVLTPRLSSYWIALVTGVDLAMARELVEGVRYDLDPTGKVLWDRLGSFEPTSLDRAIGLALADQEEPLSPSGPARRRLAELGARPIARELV